MDLIKILSSCFFVLTFTSGDFLAFAQETAKDAPVYLDEPESEPPVRVTRRKQLKETYEDKTIRAEREVAKLSDDRIVNDGKYTEFYHDGQKYVEGTYKMGVFEGDWQYWFPNGQLCKQVSFKKGKADGQWEVFNKEGKLTAKKSYQKGKRHGPWISYHKDGEQVRFELNYAQGLPVGERVTYYENGQKRQSVTFKEKGKMDGPMTEWDESGKKRAEAVFKDGKLVGEIKRYTDK